MFFDKSWSDVSEDEIEELATRLSSDMGGWIFHSRVDFEKKTPHVDVEIGFPEIMKEWVEEQS